MKKQAAREREIEERDARRREEESRNRFVNALQIVD